MTTRWLPTSTTRAIALAMMAIAGLPACHRATAAVTVDAAVDPLPALVVRDDSTGLTFSYLGVDGDFKTAKTVGEVPYESRDAVRVWVDATSAGVPGPMTYAADLRTRRGDGTYKVEVVPISYFDELAHKQRARLAASASAAAAPAPNAADPGGDHATASVIIYGADWCKPCHAAEAYLKSKGVVYVHKNVDDPLVQEELQDKLQAAGIRSNSIPVLDIGGRLLVGFAQGEVDRALASRPGR